MKRDLFRLGLALLLGATPLFATTYAEAPFTLLSPDVMGQGGGMIATAHGWGSFFTNPAGFSRERGEVTLLEAGAWTYARPDRILGFALDSISGAAPDIFSLVNTELTGGGFGAGGSVGIGYAANGLGLGVAIVADSYLWGPTALGVSGDVSATIGLMGGIAYPLELGAMRVHVGGLVRPMIRVHAPLSNTDALAMFSSLQAGNDLLAALGSASAVYGVGIGLDLGAIAELGWFAVGVSVRDIAGTMFNYSTSSVSSLVSAFQAEMGLPPGSPVADGYVIPMEIGAGVALHPDFGGASRFIDPTLHLEVKDLLSAVSAVMSGEPNLWTLIHAGAELRLLSFLSAWGGIDGGYVTLGAGVRLLFLDASMAVFTRELGRYVGDRPGSGATLEVAIRF